MKHAFESQSWSQNFRTLLSWIHCSKMTANSHHQWVQTAPDRSKSCYSYIVPSDKSRIVTDGRSRTVMIHDRSLFMRNDLPTYIRPTKGCTEETGRHWVPFAIFNIFNALQIICAPITLTFYRYHYSPIVYSTCTNLHVFICIYLHWVEYILKIISSVLIYTSMLFVPAVPHLRTLALSMVDTFILYLTAKQAYTMESFAGLAMRGPGQLQNVTAV